MPNSESDAYEPSKLLDFDFYKDFERPGSKLCFKFALFNNTRGINGKWRKSSSGRGIHLSVELPNQFIYDLQDKNRRQIHQAINRSILWNEKGENKAGEWNCLPINVVELMKI